MNQQPALYVHPSLPDNMPPPPDLGANVESLGRNLARRWWQFAWVFGTVVCLGILFLAAQTPRYTAHTVVVVASRQPDLATVDQVAAVNRPRAERDPDIESELQLMLSTSVLANVASAVGLDRLPEMNNVQTVSPVAALNRLWHTAIAGNWSAVFDGSWAQSSSSPGANGADEDARRTEAIVDLMRKQLSVTQIGRSTTIDIAFSASDPAMAARVTNAIAESYIGNRYAARVEEAQRATDYLRSRSAELQVQLRAAERAVEDYRKTNILTDGRDIEQLRAEMEKTNAELAAAKVAKVVASTKLDAVEARVRASGIVAALEPAETGAITLDDRLRELAAQARAKLAALGNRGPGYPDVQRAQQEAALLQSEVVAEATARVNRLKSNVNIAEQQVRMLEGALQHSRSDYDRLSAAVITLRSLERQAAASRAVYEGFLGRIKLTEQVGFNDAKSWVISAATPPTAPSSPKALLVMGATLILALGAAFSFVLVAERRSRQTILSAQDLAAKGYRSLGIVPDMGDRLGSVAGVIAASEHPKNTAFAESMNSIFTSVMELAARDRSCLALLVTSSLPFEGKSTTALALAARMASAGKRVLMIDADLRAPQLHRAFGLAESRGLSDIFTASLPLDEAVGVDPASGISVVTAGVSPADPQNVLRSEQFAEAIEVWRTRYDFILVDSPPVLPISDARILVPLTDYCVFVTHWGKTRWNVALHALHVLKESGARLAGVVVSKVDVRKAATYGEYSGTYGSNYRRYVSA